SSSELRKTNVRKNLRRIHERLEMGHYTAEVFSAVLPRMRILKLNACSRTPGFVYIHAPPAPEKGMQLKNRVHNPQTPQAMRKQLQTDQNHVKAESDQRSSKRRPNFTGAEGKVLLQNVEVSILFQYGYIHSIEFNAYLFIHLQCSCTAFLEHYDAS